MGLRSGRRDRRLAAAIGTAIALSACAASTPSATPHHAASVTTPSTTATDDSATTAPVPGDDSNVFARRDAPPRPTDPETAVDEPTDPSTANTLTSDGRTTGAPEPTVDATSADATTSTPTSPPADRPTTTTSTTTTTVPLAAPSVDPPPPADPSFTATIAAFDALAAGNLGASISVAHGGRLLLERATGPTVAGVPADASTPMLVASVSKLMLAATVGRLSQRGEIDLDAALPWDELGIAPHASWIGTTVRQLLDHSAGMPVSRSEWFKGGIDCGDFLPSVVASPPTSERGEWRYSNGNYCALGLLVEHVTGATVVDAVNDELFAPLGLRGAASTDDGLLEDHMVHQKPVARLSRLGAAGTFIVSSNDLATAFGALTTADLEVLRAPTVFTDQYGFGHTGTIDGAKACTWVLHDGATVMSATIGGNTISSGGTVCDRLLPALAADLGLPVVDPVRWP